MTVHYVLFASNTDAMMLDSLLRKEKIPVRVSPTPHDLQGLAGCGISLMIEDSDLRRVEDCIRTHQVPYHSIVSRARQINPRRDRFC